MQLTTGSVERMQNVRSVFWNPNCNINLGWDFSCSNLQRDLASEGKAGSLCCRVRKVRQEDHQSPYFLQEVD